MPTKNKNSKVNYAGRLLVLSLTTMIFFAFNQKIQTTEIDHTVEEKLNTIIEDNGTILSITDTIPPTQLKIKKIDLNSNDKKEVFVEGDVRRVSGTHPKEIQHNKIDGDDLNTNDTIPERVFTKVEQEAEFPGGPNKWAGYIQRILTEKVRDFGDEDYGTCVVKFIVDKNGKVSDVEATTMKGTRLARTAVEAIRKGPKWIPAMQNGQKINSYRTIPITLKNSGR